MKEITKQYVNEVKEVEKSVIGMMDGSDIKNMDIEMFKFLRTLLRLIDTSNKMVLESGEMMDEMNVKLDLLLEK